MHPTYCSPLFSAFSSLSSLPLSSFTACLAATHSVGRCSSVSPSPNRSSARRRNRPEKQQRERMGDRAYAPASKPVPVAAPRAANGVANGGGVGGGGGAARPPPMVPGRVPPPPMYRPKPMQAPARRRRSRRGWCCACCLWMTLVLVGLVFLGAIAAGVFYVVYHPQLPTFAVTSLRIAALNVSDSDAVTSRIEFTVTARNPNDKIAFAYGDIAAGFAADGGADVGDGVVPGFLHPAGNTTVIKGVASVSAATVDPVVASSLRSKKSHAMSVEMDSKVGFQIGRFKSKRINVRVLCAGFTAGLAKATPPIVVAAAPSPMRSSIKASSSSSSSSGATTTDAKCKLRVKIWIWTF